MRTKIVAGNWKMNTSSSDAHVLATGIRDGAEHIERVTTALFPPSIWIAQLAHDIISVGQFPHLKMGVQNFYYEESGAFTGEISPNMAKEVGEYALVGHSERTHIFGEKAELLNQKVHAAFQHGLIPMLCIGEDVQNASSKELLTKQLRLLIADLTSEQLEQLVVAYEPVWAIGSGTPATPEYAQEMIAHLRTLLTEKTRILYGGSVNEENAAAFLQQKDIDGFLIGGTSLKLKPFLTVCQLADDAAQAQGHRSLHPSNTLHHE